MEGFFYLPEQVAALQWLQSSFLANLHFFWFFLRHFDTTPGYLVVIGIAVGLLDRKTVIPYLYGLCFAVLYTNGLKYLFLMPRPAAFDPALDLLDLGANRGFPSGAAISSLIIGSVISRHISGTKGVLLGVSYMLLVSFSRLYLGVHFFTDILGGWFFGLIAWRFFLWLTPRLALWRQRMPFRIFIEILLLGLFWVCDQLPTKYAIVPALILGIGIGHDIPLAPIPPLTKRYRVPLAIAGTLLLLLISKFYFTEWMFGLIGFWLTCGIHLFPLARLKEQIAWLKQMRYPQQRSKDIESLRT